MQTVSQFCASNQKRVGHTSFGALLGHWPSDYGDELYYTDESKEVSDRLEIQGQMLHAGRLTFVHPITKDEIDICCEVKRKEMQSILREVGM